MDTLERFPACGAIPAVQSPERDGCRPSMTAGTRSTGIARQLSFDESTVNFQRGRHQPLLGRAHSSIFSRRFVCEGRGSPALVIPPRNSCVMARVSLMILSLRHNYKYKVRAFGVCAKLLTHKIILQCLLH
jgi:hypothetical protein